MAIEVFSRYEHKYLLPAQTYNRVREVMDAHMAIDPYNRDHKPYTISNIYYDTPGDLLIRRSLSGPLYKEKLRLRAYGVPKADDILFLEIKKKFRGLVNKRRTSLYQEEADRLIQTGSVMPADYMNRQVIDEITYFLGQYTLAPKMYLAYDRIAYFENENPDLRISFDFHIRYRDYDLQLGLGDYGKRLFTDDWVLMEVKTARTKPLWLCRLLTEEGIQRCSFSKYGEAYKKETQASKETEKIAM